MCLTELAGGGEVDATFTESLEVEPGSEDRPGESIGGRVAVGEGSEVEVDGLGGFLVGPESALLHPLPPKSGLHSQEVRRFSMLDPAITGDRKASSRNKQCQVCRKCGQAKVAGGVRTERAPI